MKKQDGFVSIIMALVIMIFVTLLALGFAFLARQNQNQNQNRVLSTQAFYAAESGVNDAVKYLKDTLASSGSLPPNVTTCNNSLSSQGFPNTVGSTNPDVKYTCVLYDTTPTSLEYSVETKDSRTIRIESQSGRPLTSVTISWQDSENNQRFATNNQHWLPQEGFTSNPANLTDGDNLLTSTGMVRATLIPQLTPITRDDLTTKSQTVFLYPKAGAANTVATQGFLTGNNIDNPNQGVFVDGNCNVNKTPRYCSVTINNLNSAVASSNVYYLRLKALYRSSKIHVSGITDDGQVARLANEQAVIDATGKATDVLRRIQVRVPLAATFNRPEYAIETVDSLCKRLQVWPGGVSVDAPSGIGAIPAVCQP